jgi:hypothetical protein
MHLFLPIDIRITVVTSDARKLRKARMVLARVLGW